MNISYFIFRCNSIFGFIYNCQSVSITLKEILFQQAHLQTTRRFLLLPSSLQKNKVYYDGDDAGDNDDEACPKVHSSSGNVLMQTGERKQKAQFHCEPAQPLNYILRNILNF